jgi:hypothetical protein
MLSSRIKHTCLVATLCVLASTGARAEPTLYGVVTAPNLNELLTYDLAQDT